MAKFYNIEVPPMQDLLGLAGAIPKEVVKDLATPAVEIVTGSVKPLAEAHYSNLLDQVRWKLKGSGMPSGTATGGAYRIPFFLYDEQAKSIRTERWAPLTDKYRKREPRSTKFWRKEKKLLNAYTARMNGRTDVEVSELKAKRNHHKGRVNVELLMRFDQLPIPFESAVAQPFVRANENLEPNLYTLSRPILGLKRAFFPEFASKGQRTRRPFLRRMSALLGKEMRKDIARKLREI